MRTKLWRDSLENEAVESWSFRVRFSGGGTLYVQIPGEWLFVMKVIIIIIIVFIFRGLHI